MKVSNEIKLKVLSDMGLMPELHGDMAVARIDYSSIHIKVLKAKKGRATLQVSFDYKDKPIMVLREQEIHEGCSLALKTSDNFNCGGILTVE